MFPARRLPNLLLGYHGTSEAIVEQVLRGGSLKPEQRPYHWLGQGIYFWQDDPLHAAYWAREQVGRGLYKVPSVVGAVISPGNTLRLGDYGTRDELRAAHATLTAQLQALNTPLPANRRLRDNIPLLRDLDCAVIDMVHTLREVSGAEPFDTVIGSFEDGAPLYTGAGFTEKTHTQIAVRNPAAILGYFRVPGL